MNKETTYNPNYKTKGQNNCLSNLQTFTYFINNSIPGGKVTMAVGIFALPWDTCIAQPQHKERSGKQVRGIEPW